MGVGREQAAGAAFSGVLRRFATFSAAPTTAPMTIQRESSEERTPSATLFVGRAT
jgi:hypothetical protein